MFAKNLRYLRRSKGYSQESLADILGYKSFTTIQKWETEASEPTMRTLKRLSNIFHVSMDALVNQDLTSSELPIDEPEQAPPEVWAVVRQLNAEGQERVLHYAEDLVASGKYKNSSSSSLEECAKRIRDEAVSNMRAQRVD